MEIKLSDFLEEWGDTLKEQVLQGMSPIYSAKKEDQWDKEAKSKLSVLIRPPLEGQTQRGILPIARYLFKEKAKSAILVGEMGTGKTYVSLAVAHLHPQPHKRILIMCPGHLVQKWIREARSTIPGCICHNINDRELRMLLDHKTNPRKPTGVEIWVIGRDRSKLHYRKKIQMFKTVRNTEICPTCCGAVEFRANDSAPKCVYCKTPLWGADNRAIRRYSKADFVRRYFPKGYFDLAIIDECHEMKSGNTAQGQAMSCFVHVAEKSLALTGTLIGGYARDLYYLFWRLFPRLMGRNMFSYSDSVSFARRYGIIETTIKKIVNQSECVASIGKKSEKKSTREKPGISPLLLPELLLERSAFVRLVHVADELPDYREFVVSVPMAAEQHAAYRSLEADLVEKAREALVRGSMKVLGKMLQSLLAYPDGCRRMEVVTVTDGAGVEFAIASAPALQFDMLPKEEKLIEILEAEKNEGRKVGVFLEHTGTRNLLPTLVSKIEQAGMTPLVLQSSTVAPELREQWLAGKMKSGHYDMLICNPNIVKTGLDLLDFPTLVFFQTGYSTYTLRQASRRSWRIGQTAPVRVFFLTYENTMQEKALALIAQKMETSLAIEGVLSDRGLAAMSESENSVLYEMARALTGKTKVKDAQTAWTEYLQRELASKMDLDIQTMGPAVDAHCKYRFRGNIYLRKGGLAVAYVNKQQFLLQNGIVYWNDKPVGQYNKRGEGEINQKPIKIYRPDGKRNFILAEVEWAA